METFTPSSNGIDHSVEKKKARKRHPWVYKFDYDFLQKKYNILKWIAIVGWLAFALAIKLA